MAIEIYKDEIYKDTDVVGDNVYFTNGQGCDTIWFASVEDARRFIAKYGRITGQDSDLCKVCACHYSYFDKEIEKYSEFVCEDWKKEMKRKAGIKINEKKGADDV